MRENPEDTEGADVEVIMDSYGQDMASTRSVSRLAVPDDNLTPRGSPNLQGAEPGRTTSAMRSDRPYSPWLDAYLSRFKGLSPRIPHSHSRQNSNASSSGTATSQVLSQYLRPRSSVVSISDIAQDSENARIHETVPQAPADGDEYSDALRMYTSPFQESVHDGNDLALDNDSVDDDNSDAMKMYYSEQDLTDDDAYSDNLKLYASSKREPADKNMFSDAVTTYSSSPRMPTDEATRGNGVNPSTRFTNTRRSSIRTSFPGIISPYMADGRLQSPDADSILSAYAFDVDDNKSGDEGPFSDDTISLRRNKTKKHTNEDDAVGPSVGLGIWEDEKASKSPTSPNAKPWTLLRHRVPDSPETSMMSIDEQSVYDIAKVSNDYRTLALVDQQDWVDADEDLDTHTKPQRRLWSTRGFANILTLIVLAGSVLMLFMGYPILHSHTLDDLRDAQVFGNVAPSSDLPITEGKDNLRRGLIDPDTPTSAYYRTRHRNGQSMKLVFSDEFNQPGRSFYPGDDPFWLAEDLHYWQTENYEWYDPAAITTKDGNLVITLSQTEDHNLFFRSGLLTTWNKFCFTGGYLEVRLSLPGFHNASGLWPAVWTMGNLGRAGYGATTEGLWPYSYDACDVGTMPNQTYLASQGGGPLAAETTGHYVDQFGPALSFLPGQRLSRCTCLDSDDHPGPRHSDGTWVGRSAPEIDVLEALANNGENEHGQASMSLQIAPFDAAYNVTHEEGAVVVHPNLTHAVVLNDYNGVTFQQAVSAKVNTSDTAYQYSGGDFDTYAFEYTPGATQDSYITWFMGGEPKFTVNSLALKPNAATEISQRSIPEEPMYIIMNLGISSSFSWINWDALMGYFPFTLTVDYVRVYQDEDKITNNSLSCDPTGFPTSAYIAKHEVAYNNPLLTGWLAPPDEGGYGHTFPGNVMMGQCS